jgi:FKBP-type peptidyl-prolyl cis-trans isomerase FklB
MSTPSTFSLLILATLMFLGNAIAQTPAAAKPATPPAKAAPGSTGKTSAAAPALTTQKDKFSYALGMNIGANLKKQSVPVNPDLFARGLRDTLAGRKLLLTEDEAHAVLMAMQNEMRKQQQEKMEVIAEANKKTGADFLAANKTKAGVVTLPSGLQYKILQAGTGPKPLATDTVTVNYRGTLTNGAEFDSSFKRGKPATFGISGVIKGWTEALQLMPVGSKWQLFIPPDLAYGDRGAGSEIGPNAVLIFEVELLSIQAPEKAADKPADKQPAETKPEEKK